MTTLEGYVLIVCLKKLRMGPRTKFSLETVSLTLMSKSSLTFMLIDSIFLKDETILNYDSKGRFSIKSAHHLASSLRPSKEGSTSNFSDGDSGGKPIEKLKISQKLNIVSALLSKMLFLRK